MRFSLSQEKLSLKNSPILPAKLWMDAFLEKINIHGDEKITRTRIIIILRKIFQLSPFSLVI
jgi:hypothetical protein